MTGKRHEFSNLLDTLTQKEVEAGPLSLAEVHDALVKRAHDVRPKVLFRFRRTEHLDSEIEDMRQHRLFLSHATGFNDTLDAVLYIDRDELLRQVHQQVTPNRAASLFDSYKRRCDDVFQLAEIRKAEALVLGDFDTNLQRYVDYLLEELHEACIRFRSAYRGACFTEELNSTNMWGNYADSGRGYAVAYEMPDCEEITCSCKDRCCRNGGQLLTLYPVIYDNQFDATNMAHMLLNREYGPPYPTSGDLLIQMNTVLRKTMNWKDEREWRIICPACDKTSHAQHSDEMYASLTVKEIYLGYAMRHEDEDKLVELSKDCGIPLFRTIEDNTAPGKAFSFMPLGDAEID